MKLHLPWPLKAVLSSVICGVLSFIILEMVLDIVKDDPTAESSVRRYMYLIIVVATIIFVPIFLWLGKKKQKPL